MLLAALTGKHAAARDIVAINAGASLYVAGRANSFEEGVDLAREVIASGAARAKVEEYVAATKAVD